MVPKLIVQSRNISRAEEWETFILNLTVTLRNSTNAGNSLKKWKLNEDHMSLPFHYLREIVFQRSILCRITSF